MRTTTLILSVLLLAGCPAPDAPAPPPAQPQSQAPRELASPDPSAKPALDQVADPKLRGWLVAMDQVPAEAFAPRAEVAEELEVYVVQSSAAASMFLQEPADPHRGAKAGAVWTAHPAGPGGIDLLRCRFQALGYPVELNEGWNLLSVRFQVPAGFSRDDLQRLLAQAVRTQRLDGTTWRLELPADLDPAQPAHLTNAGAPPVDALTSRDQRVDLLLGPGEVRLTFYKRVHQLATWNKDDGWFRASTRAALASR